MNISYSDIYKLCNYETSFFKGMTYFNSGYVKKVSTSKINSVEEYTEAKVKGSQMYNVSIWSDNGYPSRCLCDCPAFEKYDGICKHIAAALISCIPEKEIKKETAKQARKHSSAIANKIIQSYKNDEISASYSPVEKIALYPTLHIKANGHSSIEFKIDLSKKYIIKDLCEFSDNVQNAREGIYGKDTAFTHTTFWKTTSSRRSSPRCCKKCTITKRH